LVNRLFFRCDSDDLHASALPTNPPGSVTTPASDNTPYGLIIGVSIGGALLVAGLVILIVYLARRAAVAQPSVRLDAPVRFVLVFFLFLFC
jgi:hypothetical protein